MRLKQVILLRLQIVNICILIGVKMGSDFMKTGNLELLVKELCKLPDETGWVEFKHNNYDPAMIGKGLSALANSEAYYERNDATAGTQN